MTELELANERKKLDTKYATVFGSPLGREVLADILYRTHWGSTLDAENKIQIAEYNVGVYILARAGILQHMNKTILGLPEGG
jgi:hypothetical protein